MSPHGATSSSTERTQPRPATDTDVSFLPNFRDARVVLAIVLISELLALIFALLRRSSLGFFTDLAGMSLLMLWLALTSAAILSAARRPLERLSTPAASVAVLALILVNVSILSLGVVWGGRWLGGTIAPGIELDLFPSDVWPFLPKNLIVGLIVTSLLLRYCFVSQQWRHHVEAEARSRIDALQARIRPHFLFNSMNTIASLTRSDPACAEEAVEDLAEMFRASLSDANRLLSLAEELELTRVYERIEARRLGDRLRVDWDVDELPMAALVPGLTIQPLLENAIYHGIEPREDGGTVTISGRARDRHIEISVTNPIATVAESGPHRGHRIAVDNIRERLDLAFDGRGSLDVSDADGRYEVTVRFPVTA